MNEASFLATIGRPAIELFDGQPASNRMAAARKVYHSDYNDAASGKYTGKKREMTPLVDACAMLPSEDDAAALLAAACTKTDDAQRGPGIAQHTKGMDGASRRTASGRAAGLLLRRLDHPSRRSRDG